MLPMYKIFCGTTDKMIFTFMFITLLKQNSHFLSSKFTLLYLLVSILNGKTPQKPTIGILAGKI